MMLRLYFFSFPHNERTDCRVTGTIAFPTHLTQEEATVETMKYIESIYPGLIYPKGNSLIEYLGTFMPKSEEETPYLVHISVGEF